MDRKLDKSIKLLAANLKITKDSKMICPFYLMVLQNNLQILWRNQSNTPCYKVYHDQSRGEKIIEKWACSETKSIQFLNTSCHIENGKIEVDLFRKSPDRNQYILLSSCQPKTTTANIPFSLGLRIIRTCINSAVRDKRLEGLNDLLLDRNYLEKLINSEIERVKKIPRKLALKEKKQLKYLKRPVFAVKYDPWLPSIFQIQARHWRTMKSQDNYLQKVFPEPPLTGYRRQKNLREYLIRANVPGPPGRNQRNIKGMSKCGFSACPFIKKGKYVKFPNSAWKLNKKNKLPKL